MDENWTDGDLVMVTWRDNGGLSQWTGRIVGECMGPGGAKPHHIEGVTVTVLEQARSTRSVHPDAGMGVVGQPHPDAGMGISGGPHPDSGNARS